METDLWPVRSAAAADLMKPRAGSSRRSPPRVVALNFKVPFEFRQQCKVHAARRGITMTEFLIETFRQAGIVESYRDVDEDHGAERKNSETKK